MTQDTPIVYVLDDDYRVREALTSLLLSVGLRVEVFASAAEYLKFRKPDSPACLILDLELPGMSGLELQQEIAGSDAPAIVFVTGHGDVPSSVRAMKALIDLRIASVSNPARFQGRTLTFAHAPV